MSQRGPLVDSVFGVEKADDSNLRVNAHSTEAVSGINVSHLATNQTTKKEVSGCVGCSVPLLLLNKHDLLARSLMAGIAEVIIIHVVSPGSWIRLDKTF